MYCSRRGREVSRCTDTCSRCGRCNWERENQKQQGSGKKWLLLGLIIAVAVLLAVVLFLI